MIGSIYIGGDRPDGPKEKVVKKLCPDCGSTDITYGDFETYCKTCGLVLDEGIDYGEEASPDREGGNSNSRTGPPLTWTDPQAGTYSMIGTVAEFKHWQNTRTRYTHGNYKPRKPKKELVLEPKEEEIPTDIEPVDV
jgi:transcription initiation factor TFIIIB Brf1 subunit/transcription initiation factor TFIIB